jgi:hypothetical protein
MVQPVTRLIYLQACADPARTPATVAMQLKWRGGKKESLPAAGVLLLPSWAKVGAGARCWDSQKTGIFPSAFGFLPSVSSSLVSVFFFFFFALSLSPVPLWLFPVSLSSRSLYWLCIDGAEEEATLNGGWLVKTTTEERVAVLVVACSRCSTEKIVCWRCTLRPVQDG